jgi:hypothetical protein
MKAGFVSEAGIAEKGEGQATHGTRWTTEGKAFLVLFSRLQREHPFNEFAIGFLKVSAMQIVKEGGGGGDERPKRF